MKPTEIIKHWIFPSKDEITKEVFDYYEKYPNELDLIINKEHFNAMFLGVFFLIGLMLTITARMVQYVYG